MKTTTSNIRVLVFTHITFTASPVGIIAFGNLEYPN
jgi:hypothetical protein